MHTKGRFGVSRNMNKLVGVAADAFKDEVILNECKALNNNDEVDDETKIKLPEISKQFLVYIATAWSPKGKIQFLIARYGLPTVKSPFLVRDIRDIAVVLIHYGSIVDTITGDGASENRSVLKKLCSISAQAILIGQFTTKQMHDLPLDIKISFPHPHPLYRKDVFIVIGGEMPHWVKKFWNKFENKSRNLSFRGKDMNLEKIYSIWLASGDADVTGGAAIRKYKFTHDHFVLNAYLKMRVFLAVQIPSQTTIQMIKDNCNCNENLADIEDYEPMIEIFNHVDRLVDVMNGVGFKNGKDRNVELINSPTHSHILELFDALCIFEDWKEECGGYNNKFITNYTHEDLIWMVFGVAGISCLYLDAGGDISFHPGRSGTNVCEHFFR